MWLVVWRLLGGLHAPGVAGSAHVVGSVRVGSVWLAVCGWQCVLTLRVLMSMGAVRRVATVVGVGLCGRVSVRACMRVEGTCRVCVCVCVTLAQGW